MNIIQNQEFEYLMRKLPIDVINNHHSFDELLANRLLSKIKIKDGTSVKVMTSSLRAVFTTMLHTREIGEDEFDEVLMLLITGITNEILED